MDVPATIFAELELPQVFSKPSIFEIDATQERTRFHSAFEFSPKKIGYVDDMIVYVVKRDSWLNLSWVVDEIRSAERSNTH